MSDIPGSYFESNNPTYTTYTTPEVSMQDSSFPGPDLGSMVSVHGDGGLEVSMDGATEERPDRITQAKRVAIANPGRNEIADAHAATEAAKEKVKLAKREKRELEAKFKEAQGVIAALQNQQQTILQNRDHDLEQQRQHWGEQWNQFKGQLDQAFQQQLEQQRADNFNQMKQQMEGHIAAREAELQARVQEIEEESRRQQELLRLEKEKNQADFDTKMAAFHARFSSQRLGAQHPQNNEMEEPPFPEGPPARTPQYVSEATRADRRLETVMRQGPGRFPVLTVTERAEPVPSEVPETSTTPTQNTPQLLNLDDPRVLERLKALLGEAKQPQKRRRAKIGATAALNGARKEQQEQLAGKDDRRWKMIARETWRHSTGLIRARDFFDYNGVSEEIVSQCEEGTTAPEAITSKLFFGTGWANCVWNKTILDKYVQEVLRKRTQDPGHYEVPDVSNGYLVALFFNCLKEARSEWSRHQPRLGETHVEARERANKYDAMRRVKNVLTSRKRNKFLTRRQTVEKMIRISLATNDTAGVETWKWLGEELLGKLGVGGMSSEEDEAAEITCGDVTMVSTAHKISTCPWRLQKITDYVVTIDKTAETCTTKAVNKRMRVRSDKRSTTDPPLGLPIALYDSAWLTEQKKYVPDIEEQLEISQKEFGLKEIVVTNLGEEN